ncbi:hypothetical protein GCM10027418_10280 [Mariniluteicoccus endophyticus]
MPTYQYRCKECQTDLEVVQKFTDDALTRCPECGRESLRKVYNAVGVHFKGSGFYRTDSREAKTSSSKPSEKKSETKSSDSSSSSSSSTSSTSSSSSSTGTSGSAAS